MEDAKKNIISGLRKELLTMQGLSNDLQNPVVNMALGSMRSAFPNQSFPVSAVHEFISHPKDVASTAGFVGVLVSALMNRKGAVLWISSTRSVFPPALHALGIAPDKIIFIFLQNDKQISWAMEEALKCTGLSAVIGEMKELGFTTSRRLQLAVEKSHVTGFVLRCNPRQLQANACVSRWKIKPLGSDLPGKMPGIGFPRWEVELLKIRNGQPGKWQIEFRGGRMRFIRRSVSMEFEQQKKAV